MPNLSEQLCQICGIEQKTIRPLLCSRRRYSCELCIEKFGKCNDERQVYPDFEKPENFVKLFNLEFDTLKGEQHFSTIADFVCSLEYSVTNTKSFLDLLKLVLESDTNLSPRWGQLISDLKQAIKQAEWRY